MMRPLSVNLQLREYRRSLLNQLQASSLVTVNH
jgi:hypothetical protein